MRTATTHFPRVPKEPKKPWVFDKKINLGVILLLAVHTIGAIYYAGKLESRVSSMEKQNEDIKSDIRDIRNYIMDKK